MSQVKVDELVEAFGQLEEFAADVCLHWRDTTWREHSGGNRISCNFAGSIIQHNLIQQVELQLEKIKQIKLQQEGKRCKDAR